MRINRLMIIYTMNYIILYLIVFLVFFNSDESAYSLKRVVLINGLFIFMIAFFDKKNELFNYHLLLYLCTSYISIISYMYIHYGKAFSSFIDMLIYPFRDGRNGMLFTYLFSIIIWIIIFIVLKISKIKKSMIGC